jgi:hypothetical protein
MQAGRAAEPKTYRGGKSWEPVVARRKIGDKAVIYFMDISLHLRIGKTSGQVRKENIRNYIFPDMYHTLGNT